MKSIHLSLWIKVDLAYFTPELQDIWTNIPEGVSRSPSRLAFSYHYSCFVLFISSFFEIFRVKWIVVEQLHRSLIENIRTCRIITAKLCYLS